jgi:hypothetical protein
MNISTRAKALIGAVAIGGAAVAMGGAFTAGGLAAGTDVESKPVFIGGKIMQTVEGATLASVVYGFDNVDDPTNIESVTLNFDVNSKAATKTPTIVVGDGSVAYTCEPVGTTTADVSTCGPQAPGVFAGVGINSLAITVPSSNTGA